MKINLKLGRSGMNMEEAVIAKWHRKAGEAFKKGDVLYEVENEKSVEEIEATSDGVLLEIHVPEGGEAKVGQVLCSVNLEKL
jgi:pyruvate dehydrogenase E2 component (dihydrolipoamide acetyltransferase)